MSLYNDGDKVTVVDDDDDEEGDGSVLLDSTATTPTKEEKDAVVLSTKVGESKEDGKKDSAEIGAKVVSLLSFTVVPTRITHVGENVMLRSLKQSTIRDWCRRMQIFKSATDKELVSYINFICEKRGLGQSVDSLDLDSLQLKTDDLNHYELLRDIPVGLLKSRLYLLQDFNEKIIGAMPMIDMTQRNTKNSLAVCLELGFF